MSSTHQAHSRLQRRDAMRLGASGLCGLLTAFSLPSHSEAKRPGGVGGTAPADWETNAAGRAALDLGFQWLASHQGAGGNWECEDLGLIGLAVLAFLADGHLPGRGRYGEVVQRALAYVVDHARPSGLLNITGPQRDMYNHGLATFVLGQAYGMSATTDERLGQVLQRAIQLIVQTQADDGGWSYRAKRLPRGHDLSLVVMQAKALRSAVDTGFDAPASVVNAAIQSVREHYSPVNGRRFAPEEEQKKTPGQFTYGKGGGGGTVAMAAAGVVCLQEFGQYDDWRIEKNLEVLRTRTEQLPPPPDVPDGAMPFDAYTLYYVGQAAYQAGGDAWREIYPKLRDYLVASQYDQSGPDPLRGCWHDRGANRGGRVGGKSGDLFATAVACFVLAIPNRFLPILQDGRLDTDSRGDA